jgi:hypothetical protein
VEVDNTIFEYDVVTAPGYTDPLDVTASAIRGGSLNDGGYNLVGLSDAALFKALGDIANNNPGLAIALANNNALPGYQQTLALAGNSPALGTGDPALAGTTDARGRTRQKGTVSIGAEDPNAQ